MGPNLQVIKWLSWIITWGQTSQERMYIVQTLQPLFYCTDKDYLNLLCWVLPHTGKIHKLWNYNKITHWGFDRLDFPLFKVKITLHNIPAPPFLWQIQQHPNYVCSHHGKRHLVNLYMLWACINVLQPHFGSFASCLVCHNWISNQNQNRLPCHSKHVCIIPDFLCVHVFGIWFQDAVFIVFRGIMAD